MYWSPNTHLATQAATLTYLCVGVFLVCCAVLFLEGCRGAAIEVGSTVATNSTKLITTSTPITTTWTESKRLLTTTRTTTGVRSSYMTSSDNKSLSTTTRTTTVVISSYMASNENKQLPTTNRATRVVRSRSGATTYDRFTIDDLLRRTTTTGDVVCQSCVRTFVGSGGCDVVNSGQSANAYVQPACISCRAVTIAYCQTYQARKSAPSPSPTPSPSPSPQMTTIFRSTRVMSSFPIYTARTLDTVGPFVAKVSFNATPGHAEAGLLDFHVDGIPGWKLGIQPRLNSTDSVVKFVMTRVDEGQSYVQSNALVSDGVWHTVEAHYDGESIYIVLDGVRSSVVTGSFQPYHPTAALLIGGDDCCPGRVFNGEIKDVVVSISRDVVIVPERKGSFIKRDWPIVVVLAILCLVPSLCWCCSRRSGHSRRHQKEHNGKQGNDESTRILESAPGALEDHDGELEPDQGFFSHPYEFQFTRMAMESMISARDLEHDGLDIEDETHLS